MKKIINKDEKYEIKNMKNLKFNYKLTEHFELIEFVKAHHFEFLTPEIIQNLFIIATYLEVIRGIVRESIYITSGFRPPEYNRQIGGAPNSLHQFGKAVDFKIMSDFKYEGIIDYLKTIPVGEVILYYKGEKPNRIHLSLPHFFDENRKVFRKFLYAQEGSKKYYQL